MALLPFTLLGIHSTLGGLGGGSAVCANIRFIDMETSDGAKLGRPLKRALAGF